MALQDKDLPRALSIATALSPALSERAAAAAATATIPTVAAAVAGSLDFLERPDQLDLQRQSDGGQAVPVDWEGGGRGRGRKEVEADARLDEEESRLLRLLDVGLAESELSVVGRTYEWLRERGVLRNFGRFQNTILEAEPRVVTPSVLKSRSGLEASRLAPRKWGLSTPILPIALFASFSLLVDLGVDLRPLAIVTLGMAMADSIYLGGAGGGQVLMTLWTPFRERVLVHEAGHVLTAYLVGCPVRGVVLDAFKAMESGIRGQAGTQFWDEALDAELREGRLTGSTVDRYSVVLFAGIAAEAMVYGQADGGEGDENLFKSFISNLQPSWSPPKMANQARWSVLQAHQLLQQNKAAHSAVVKVLQEGGGMKDIVTAIERNMTG